MVDTPAVEEPFSPASGTTNPADKEDLVRPSAPARAAVHHRDVGAVRLLRHAGAADALSDQAFPVLATSQATGLYGGYHRAGLPDAADRRLPRRPVSRLEALGEVRRDPDGDRLFHAVLRRRSRPSPTRSIDGQRYEVSGRQFRRPADQRPQRGALRRRPAASSCRSSGNDDGIDLAARADGQVAQHARQGRDSSRAASAIALYDRDHADRAVADLGRQRLLQAQHLDHRRRALRAGRPPPRRRLHHLLHGHQPRLDPRAAASARCSPTGSAGGPASASPASAC